MNSYKKRFLNLIPSILLTSSLCSAFSTSAAPPDSATTNKHAAASLIIRHNISKAAEEKDPKKKSVEKEAARFNTYEQRCSCINQCKLDVSFGIADIKYDNGALKILEFGEGTRSMFSGYDSIYGVGEMWRNIWDFLSQQNRSLYFVDKDLTTPAARRTVAYTRLATHRGVGCAALHTLLNHPRFTPNTPSLTIIRHETAHAPHLQQFAQIFPETLICNAAIAPFVNNKKQSDQLFSGTLRQFRPWALTINKQAVHNAIPAILQACPAAAFVIKPLASCKGNGVLFASRENLAATLQTILQPAQRGPKTLSPNEAFWRHDKNTELIIESCETSKAVLVEGAPYDATLRVVYGLAHTPQRIQSSILGMYWKLPTTPLNQKGSLQDKKLSHISGGTCAAPVLTEDAAAITAIVQPLLAQIYDQMISSSTLHTLEKGCV